MRIDPRPAILAAIFAGSAFAQALKPVPPHRYTPPPTRPHKTIPSPNQHTPTPPHQGPPKNPKRQQPNPKVRGAAPIKV